MRALRPTPTFVLTLVLTLAMLILPAASARAAEPGEAVRGVVERMSACTGVTDRPLTIAVAGLAREETALSAREAETVRLAVEAAIEAGKAARLLPARDVARLRALREGTTGMAGAETERLIERAFEGDAVMFLVAPARGTDGTVRVALQAVSADGACKSTSQPVVFALAPTGGDDPDRLIARTLAELDAAARGYDALAVCPVRTEGGHSACAPVLTERLAALAAGEAQRANRVLTDRPLAVSRAAPAQCTAPDAADGGIVARGSLSGGAPSGGKSGGTWLALEFRRGAQVLAALPRTRIDASALGCDPAPLPFLDYVARTAARDRGRIDIAAASTPFRAGERLEIAMTVSEPTALHCWVLAPDGTAFVALPARADAPPVQGAPRYPADFGLGDVVLSGAFENLFQCFAPAAALPDDLARLWREAGPAGDAPRLLDADEVGAVMDAMRAESGMGEATTRVVVR